MLKDNYIMGDFHYLNSVCDFHRQRLGEKIRRYLERDPVAQK